MKKIALTLVFLATPLWASSPPPTYLLSERCKELNERLSGRPGNGTAQRPTITPPAPCVVVPPGPGDPAQVTATWAIFITRLTSGDLDGALTMASPRFKPRLTEILHGLTPDENIRDIVRSWGTLTITDLTDSIAEAVVTQPEGGGTALHFIYFIRDAEGQWYIDAM